MQFSEFKNPEEIRKHIAKSVHNSSDLKSKIDEQAAKNKKLWKDGTSKDLSQIHPKKAKVINNRIFTDQETILPIITANTPEPTVLNFTDNAQRELVQHFFEVAYEVKYSMQQKLQKMVRNWFFNRIGVLKYRWNKGKGDAGFTVEVVLPKKVGFDKTATNRSNCEFAWEEMESSRDELMAKFPDAAGQIKEKYRDEGKIKYKEFWGNYGEWVAWDSDKMLLGAQPNPNWDEQGKNNLFDSKRIPYLIFSIFNWGDETGLYDETSLIEQAAPLQEGVNMLEQQIIDLNEGQKRVWGVSAESMSEEKAKDIANKLGDFVIYYDKKTPAGGITLPLSGRPDSALFQNLTHLLAEIDNVMGTHSTLRGERDKHDTLGSRQMMVASDVGRLDLIVRGLEQLMEEWYMAYLHMLKVYTVGGETLTNEQGQKFTLDPQTLPANIQVMVKKGSTLPTDDRSRMQQAIELAGMDMIDPGTLFEELGYGNEQDRTQKLLQWLTMTGKITAPAPPAPTPGGGPPAAGGGAPPAPGAPAVNVQADAQTGQLKKIEEIIQSPQFQQLPPEEQKQFVQRAKQIVESIKASTQ